jgi:hypothetical protein
MLVAGTVEAVIGGVDDGGVEVGGAFNVSSWANTAFV